MFNVLLVEDETNLRANIAEILMLNNFDVITAENGKKALELLRNNSPDIIISDIYMPEMSGFEFYYKLQQDKHLKSIPFVFLSARAELRDIRTGMNMGVDDYITKPVKHTDLINCLNIRLEKRRRMAEEYSPATENQSAEETQKIEELQAILASFTDSERRVFDKLSQNKNSVQIGQELHLSFKTVQNHRANMVKKVGISGQNALLSIAVSCRLLGLIK
jgi:DNA-binding NarL/FixJ family response regulator